METITKPYYKYKKDAYKKLSETILGMLKRIESLRGVIDFQSATYEDFKFFISFSESNLASIDIYYQGRISLGYILLPVFDYDPVRFYVDSDYSNNEYGVVLEKKETKVIREESLVLFKPSQTSSEICSEGHVTATAYDLIVAYIEIDSSSVNRVIYRD